MAVENSFAINVSTEGEVEERDVERALDKLNTVVRVSSSPALLGRIRLIMEADPARERPAKVIGSVDLDGQVVRAYVAAATMPDAIDKFEGRIQRQISDHSSRRRALQRKNLEAGDGHWRKGDIPQDRPVFFDRPLEDREIVRRKSFTPGPSTPDEAVFDMETMDHDFFLFNNVNTQEDNLVYRASEQGYKIIQPTPNGDALNSCSEQIQLSSVALPTQSVDDAVDALNGSELKFVFFIDESTDRGAVIYRRYDGHYGLITIDE